MGPNMTPDIKAVYEALSERDLIGKPLTRADRDDIAKELGVSASTVGKIKKVADLGGYELVMQVVNRSISMKMAINGIPKKENEIDSTTTNTKCTTKRTTTSNKRTTEDKKSTTERTTDDDKRTTTTKKSTTNKAVCPIYITGHALNCWGHCVCGHGMDEDE